jgi:hypothetical protein
MALKRLAMIASMICVHRDSTASQFQPGRVLASIPCGCRAPLSSYCRVLLPQRLCCLSVAQALKGHTSVVLEVVVESRYPLGRYRSPPGRQAGRSPQAGRQAGLLQAGRQAGRCQTAPGRCPQNTVLIANPQGQYKGL